MITQGPRNKSFSVNQLQQWFRNRKRDAKKKTSEHKALVRATGGGSPPEAVDEDLQEMVKSMGDSAKPISNPHCSDTGFFADKDTVPASAFEATKRRKMMQRGKKPRAASGK